jgi:hypothetical protein
LRARFAVKLRFIETKLMKKMSSTRISGSFGKVVVQGILAVVIGAMVWKVEARPTGEITAPTAVKAKILKVTPLLEKTPEFTAATSDNKKDPRRREWLEVEVEFETTSDSRIGIIPELTISYYVPVAGAAPTVLTGSFTYSNIQDKEKNFAVVYVSPHGLTRLMGEPNKFKLSNLAKQGVGVEILYQGRVVAEFPETKWWTAASATRTTDLLLPKEKTPFGMLWIDRHIELKAEK